MITISNQTEEPTRLDPGRARRRRPRLRRHSARGTGTIKAALEEGEYQALAGDSDTIKPAAVTVGPPGESSQNDLLLP